MEKPDIVKQLYDKIKILEKAIEVEKEYSASNRQHFLKIIIDKENDIKGLECVIRMIREDLDMNENIKRIINSPIGKIDN